MKKMNSLNYSEKVALETFLLATAADYHAEHGGDGLVLGAPLEVIASRAAAALHEAGRLREERTITVPNVASIASVEGLSAMPPKPETADLEESGEASTLDALVFLEANLRRTTETVAPMFLARIESSSDALANSVARIRAVIEGLDERLAIFAGGLESMGRTLARLAEAVSCLKRDLGADLADDVEDLYVEAGDVLELEKAPASGFGSTDCSASAAERFKARLELERAERERELELEDQAAERRA